MSDTSRDGLLAAANRVRMDALDRDPWLAALRLAGIGWATVELERAAEELAIAFRRAGVPEPSWEEGQRDDHLGASAWVATLPWPLPGGDSAPALVLLEPATEGRLAASLARFGEGVAATYLARRQDARPAPDERLRLGAPAAGPLGRGQLVLARPAWGPHVVVLAAAR